MLSTECRYDFDDASTNSARLTDLVSEGPHVPDPARTVVRAHPIRADGRGRRTHLDPHGDPLRSVLGPGHRRRLRAAAHPRPGIRVRGGHQVRLRVLPFRRHRRAGRRLARAPPDVADAALFGNAIVNAKTGAGLPPVDLTLFGIEPGSFLEPAAAEATHCRVLPTSSSATAPATPASNSATRSSSTGSARS